MNLGISDRFVLVCSIVYRPYVVYAHKTLSNCICRKKKAELLAKKLKNFQVTPAEVCLNPVPGNNRLLFLELWWNFGRILRCIWQLTSIDLNKNYVPEFHKDLGLTAVDVDFGYRSALVGSLV